MREIIRASAWNGFRELVEQLGGDADAILAAAHVDPAQLEEAERFLPLRAYIDSQEIAAERLKRPDFGLLFGQTQDISMLGALSIAITNAPTAREGIEIAGRYLHVHNPSFHMTLTPLRGDTRELISVALDWKRPPRAEQNDERVLSSIHKSMGVLGGPTYKALEVWFPHKRIAPLAAYREVFGVTPDFGQPSLSIVVARTMLDAWRPGHSTQLRSVAESYLKSVGSPRTAPFAGRVASMTRGLLSGGQCSSTEAAAALGIHERTLQRKLKAEGYTFEKIKDEVRRDMAESLLAQPNVPLSRIALMLEYNDSSAFTRSCRRWFGEAPSAVRKRLLEGQMPRRREETMHPLIAGRRAAKAVERNGA